VPELGAQEVSDGGHVLGGGVAFGACLGGLDLGVHRFDEAVAQAAAEVLDDAAQMITQRGAEAFERSQATSPRPADPSPQPLFCEQRIRAGVIDRAQRLLQTPAARRLQSAALQPVHYRDLCGIPVRRTLEQGPTAAFEVGFVAGFGAPHLIQRLTGQRHDMERIEADAGLRTGARRTALEALGHIHTDVRDRRRIAAMGLQVGAEGRERLGIATGRGKQ